MKFNYQARTRAGEPQSGVVEASTKEAALSLLQKYGLYITLLEEVETVPFFARKVKFLERVTKRDIATFFRQLSIMFKSEVSLAESLRTLAFQTRKLTFKEKIEELADAVEGGSSLSLALIKFPRIFSPFYISMLKSGEVSGTLADSLKYLAGHIEREYRLGSKLKGAMIYPFLILIVTVAVIGLMVVFVIPQLELVLEQSGQQLPLLTRAIIGASNFLRITGIYLLFGVLAAGIFISYYIRTKEGRKFFDKFFLQVPLLDAFLRKIYIARFSENLSTLIKGGIPISQALEISGEVVGNTVYKDIIFRTRDEVRRGAQISKVLERFPEEFPPLFNQMAFVGEKTGTLDKSLVNVTNFYQEEVDRDVDNFFTIIEPALIIFLGIVVGGLMAAILVPIYQLGGAI